MLPKQQNEPLRDYPKLALSIGVSILTLMLKENKNKIYLITMIKYISYQIKTKELIFSLKKKLTPYV